MDPALADRAGRLVNVHAALSPVPGGFSIVIPSVRHERAVSLVRSVRALVGSDIEIVVVDDTSSGAVMKAFETLLAESDHRLTKVVRGPAKGPSAARNFGARSASGPWVLFIDDDVAIGAPALEAAHVFAATHSTLEALEFAIVSDKRAENGSWRWRRVQRLVAGGFLAACVLVSRESFLAVGGFEESWPYPFREDTDLGLRLGASGVAWSFVDDHLVTHPDERVTFRQLLRHAKFSRVEPLFMQRHGMTGTVRTIRLGPLRVRGVRIWFPAASVVGMVVLFALRVPVLAALLAYLSGSVLSASHSQYLGYSQPVDLALAVSPSRVIPWSFFSTVSGAAFIRGLIAAYIRPTV